MRLRARVVPVRSKLVVDDNVERDVAKPQIAVGLPITDAPLRAPQDRARGV
jgi:hypothetical protein